MIADQPRHHQQCNVLHYPLTTHGQFPTVRSMRPPTPLKRALFDSGLRHKDVAAEVGLDPSHFSRIVNGLHCDDATRDRIADVLGRQVSELWPAAAVSR